MVGVVGFIPPPSPPQIRISPQRMYMGRRLTCYPRLGLRTVDQGHF